jgi:hypothetical protein
MRCPRNTFVNHFQILFFDLLFQLDLCSDFLTNGNPFLQQVRSFALLKSSSRQGTTLLNRRGQSVDITPHTRIQDNGIAFGIRMATTLQDGQELFGILLWAAPLQVDQLTFWNSYRAGIKIKSPPFVDFWFAGEGLVFDLKPQGEWACVSE